MGRWRGGSAWALGAYVAWGLVGIPAAAAAPCTPEEALVDGALVKASDAVPPDASVYYVLRGRRWLIPDEPRFWALGLSFADVCHLPEVTVQTIPRGPDIGLEGTLFLCPSCPEPTAVYRVDTGARRHIANEFVLHRCLSRSDNDIFTVATPAFQDLYPEGWEIEADCEPGDVEDDSCGACGQQLRTCEATCTWSAWSACVGEGDCMVPTAAPAAATASGCGAGGPTDLGLLAVAAFAVVGARRRRRVSM